MSYFNESMTYAEAQNTLWELARSKNKDELEQLKRDFREISRIIFEREAKETSGCLTSY